MSRIARLLVVAAAAAVVVLGTAPAAEAHGFSSTVYADLTSPAKEHVRAQLGLEYDLLVVSAADAAKDDPLFKDGTAAFESGDSAQQAAALTKHADTVVRYATQRFTITADGQACTANRDGDFTIEEREGVPYVALVQIGRAHV